MNELDPPNEAALRRAWLADRDEPCPGCGYSLRGLETDRCPECNQRLALAIALADGRSGPLVAAIAGLAAGAGTAAAMLVLVFDLSIAFGDWAPAPAFLIPIAALLIEGTALAMLARRRGRIWFRGFTRQVQNVVVALAWLITAAFVVIVIGYLHSL